MDYESAQNSIKGAVEEAKNLNLRMSIAVVDQGANLVCFVRMDDALLGSADIAIRKAKTAVFFNVPTGKLGELSQPGGPLFNIEHSNGGLITFAGGVPIHDPDGNIIGGIGVSGGSVEEDHLVAEAGKKASGVGKKL